MGGQSVSHDVTVSVMHAAPVTRSIRRARVAQHLSTAAQVSTEHVPCVQVYIQHPNTLGIAIAGLFFFDNIGQTGPKWEILSGTFSDQISVHFGSGRQNVLKWDQNNPNPGICNENRSQKVPDLSHFLAKSDSTDTQ